MRRFPFSLLLALSLLAPSVSAQEAAEQAPAVQNAEPEASFADVEAIDTKTLTLLNRLRQENQRLKLQLQEAQTQVPLPLPLLSEEQKWFAVGGSVGVVSFLLGLLVTRGRRRRQWLN